MGRDGTGWAPTLGVGALRRPADRRRVPEMSASGRFRSRRVPYGALVGLAFVCLAVVLLVLAGGPTTEQPDGQVRVTFLWESDCGQEGAPFELEIEDAEVAAR